ncbi:hypothetical protein PP175_26985 (plasmid) [Aneurinibacillus sp. Ricciae_BoGa-3]|uniref:hypothetical protein n=1 Tax=Aneurinibacillus sp. Ricciae_BoGa-3 TaxID=3022697 RepID=UPI002340AAB7|nr:hypothetical protein [Aneurinibacillus sp. Ricciae_BoGa-3]WCK57684.1 hypothetical protein PP175_26985 [Aneurinibacillus sp. Ricciae_BoGa-3]
MTWIALAGITLGNLTMMSLSPQKVYASTVVTNTQTLTFPSNTLQNRSQTITLPSLKDITSVQTDNGNASYSVNGNQVTVNVSNGTGTVVQTGGSYTPPATKYVTGQTSADYQDAQGYSGTLSQYLESGSYSPSDTKYVTGQTSANYQDAQGYSGTLTQYVESGSATPADTKWVTAQTSPNYNSGGYSGILSQYVYSGTYTPSDSISFTGNADGGQFYAKVPDTNFQNSINNYNYNGYVGNLYRNHVDWTMQSHQYLAPTEIEVDSTDPSGLNFDYNEAVQKIEAMGLSHVTIENYYWANNPTRNAYSTDPPYCSTSYPCTWERMMHGDVYGDLFTANVVYTGTLIKPASDTRVYRYQGYVTRPASDTRVFKYQGNVTKPASDTRVFKYQGNVTKPAVDTRTWETRYAYNVTIHYTSAPNAPILNVDAPDNQWVSQDVNVNIADGGNTDASGFHVEYSLEGATNQNWTTYFTPFAISADGVTTIHARVVNNDGSISDEITKTIKIDKLPPNLSVTSDTSDLTNTNVTLTAIATDTGTGVKRIQLHDGNWISGSQATYQVAQNGTYSFTAEDYMGHTKTVSYVVSNIKKNVLITNKPLVGLLLHAEDTYSGVAQMQFRNEHGSWSSWEPYQTNKDWTLSNGDGLKHVWVQYADQAGNASAPIEDIIILDTMKPTISLFNINDNASYTNNPNVTLAIKGSDSLTGVKDMFVSNDGVNWTQMPYAESLNWTLSNGDGNKTVYLKISDVAGNISTISTANIFLDTTKPVVSIQINHGATFTPTRDVQLTLNYSDIGGSGIDTVNIIEGNREYTLPKPVANAPLTLPWTLDYGMTRTVSIQAIDKAGNVSDIASASIVVDKLTLQRFTIENVVNPLQFNDSNPFVPKVWAFEPQPMLAGGNFTFSVDLKEPYDSSVVTDGVSYKVDVVGDNGYHQAFLGTMNKSANHYTQTITLPKDVPNGANVYVSAVGTRKLLVSPYDTQTVYFPGADSSEQAKIGTVTGNIYNAIHFNETH